MKKFVFLIAGIICFTLFHSSAFAAGVNGNAQISGMFDGSPIVIKTTDRLAGAIGSLTWKGTEFVDNFDHGREIQYAWQLNSKGECYNPTEAGSSPDGYGETSTSILLSIDAHNNTLTTQSHPAFWTKPGQNIEACTAFNTTLVTADVLKKTVTIGWQGIPNVIELAATITTKEPYTRLQLEAPTEYLPNAFNTFWTYDPKTRILTPATLHPISYLPNSTYAEGHIPFIISTSNKAYAVGTYIPDLPEENIGAHRDYNVWNLSFASVSKWSMVIVRTDTPVGNYRYRTYMAIGTIGQVTNALDRLYNAFTPYTPTPTPTHQPTATPTPAYLSGDLNHDHHVNSADYDILVPYLGRTGAPGFIPADINRDGKVDIFDYNILVGNFGRTQ